MYEMIVGLNVVDESVYALYRKEMTPILQSYGGGFRYDFTIAKTHQSAAAHEITRLFAIYFPDFATKERFFGDKDYKAIRAKYLEQALNGRTSIAEYERE